MRSTLGLLLLLLLSAPLYPQDIFAKNIHPIITQELGAFSKLPIRELIIQEKTQNTIEYQVGQRFGSPSLVFGTVLKGNHTNGYFFIDTFLAKHSTFDVFILFDQELKVKTIRILRNPDPGNKKIQDNRWLKKFSGMDAHSDFAADQQVDSISGASLSVNAMLKGVWRLSLLLDHIVHKTP